MKNTLIISTLVALCLVSSTTAFAGPGKPYRYDFEPRLVAKTNKEIEKMMPILEKQVELLIKMVGNGKYRAKLESEFTKVIATYDSSIGYSVEKCASAPTCPGLGTRENASAWDSGQKLSFLASVLKKYKAPLSKTCIGVVHKDESTSSEKFETSFQPLNWHFPLQFLSGSMFGSKLPRMIGFGEVDLRSLDESELIKMANLSNQIVELQIMLRDGIEDQFNDDALQKIKSYEQSGEKYYGPEYIFGTQAGMGYDKQPCEFYAGKGSAKKYWPVIGYEMILPAEIVTSSYLSKTIANCGGSNCQSYSFGGGELKHDFAKFPPEYINAWKNLAIYYQDYFPYLPLKNMSLGDEIDMYDAMLAAKTEEPLGDLMSEDSSSESDSSTSEDDDLALPSLD